MKDALVAWFLDINLHDFRKENGGLAYKVSILTNHWACGYFLLVTVKLTAWFNKIATQAGGVV
jgi:hypothetical protein